MRWLLPAFFLLTGCGTGLQFNNPNMMPPDQMLDRATLVFVGTVERQTFVNWPFLQIPGQDAGYWRGAREGS